MFSLKECVSTKERGSAGRRTYVPDCTHAGLTTFQIAILFCCKTERRKARQVEAIKTEQETRVNCTNERHKNDITGFNQAINEYTRV